MKAELINHMGDDLAVVNAARVSFNKESEWEYDFVRNRHAGVPETHYEINPHLSEKDQKLISYLAKHNHWTPFSHVMITMRETVPIFVARQRFKHMVGFTYNEESRRYVNDDPTFYIPDVWREAAENKKQGSSDREITHLEVDEHEVWDDPSSPKLQFPIADYYDAMLESCSDFYKLLIKNDVAPEQARIVLPQSMYTSYYVTGSLAAWARAYKLRIDPHAQKEIQDLAKQWNEIISSNPEMKHSWEALTKEA